MSQRKIEGVTVKLTGKCSLVSEISGLLEEFCELIHTGRIIHHNHDDGCHTYLEVSGVIKDE